MRRDTVTAAGAVALAVLALAAASYGGTGAAGVLEETASRMGAIGSGHLHLRMAASAGASGAELPVGFELEGPFALADEQGELPLARLRFTRLLGKRAASSTFVALRQRAFVEVDGTGYELPPEQVDGLRAARSLPGGASALGDLDVHEWARDPELTDAGMLDGVPARRVTAGLDVVEALNDLMAVARRVGAAEEGAPLGPIEGEDARRLRRAVRSSRLEVVTGRRDRLLRQLRVQVTLAPPDVRHLERALGPLAGARISLELRIAGPNRKVRVEPPAVVRPLSELPAGRR